MLLQSEIKVGETYIWDLDDPITRVVKIVGDTGKDCSRLTVECIDSLKLKSVGEHCLTTIERAMARLSALGKASVPEIGTQRRWSYDKELKYLTEVKNCLLKHGFEV